MKLFKKAREALKRITGNDDQTPPPAPAADLRYKYRRDQRDFERRAAETTLIHSAMSKAMGGGGSYNAGRNAAKRSLRAALEPKFGRRWKKQHIPAAM